MSKPRDKRITGAGVALLVLAVGLLWAGWWFFLGIGDAASLGDIPLQVAGMVASWVIGLIAGTVGVLLVNRA